MQKIDAINWMENWAGRHDLVVRPHHPIRPGESRAGLVMEIVAGQLVTDVSLDELMSMGNQLSFSEMEPVPPPHAGSPSGVAGGVVEEEESEPAATNRAGRLTVAEFKGFSAGKNSLFAAVDQFTLVGRGEQSRAAMQGVVAKYLGDGQVGLFGLNTYKQSWRWDGGASLNHTDGRDDWCLIITGQALQLVGEAGHVQFVLDVHEHAHHCTRVDPRIDDYSRKLIDLELVRSAMEVGNFVGPRKFRVETSGRISKGVPEREGATLYFGSRSGALVRFYDKGLESKGRVLSIRCEVEYHDEKANAAWLKLIDAARFGVERFTRAVGELVGGSIDFVQRKGANGHVDRMQRLTWWASIVETLGRVSLKVEKALSTLNSACASMINQYGKKLARAVVVAEGMGYDIRLQLVDLIDSLREGQELSDRNLSPLETEFQPVRAFRDDERAYSRASLRGAMMRAV